MAYRQNYRTPQQIRNSPNPDLEDELSFAQLEADEAADKIINRYAAEPEFLKNVLVAAAKKLMPKEKKVISEDKEVTNGSTESLL